MPHSTPGLLTGHLRGRWRRLRQAPGLPFAGLLTEAEGRQALGDEQVRWRERRFSPVATVWIFLSQVLAPDHSCRQAVTRFLAYLLGCGRRPCSRKTGAYGKARGRLPEGVLARLTRQAGRRLHQEADPRWRWKGRAVQVVDGTTAALPDTRANQAALPQHCQRPGLGFPIARVVARFSRAAGPVLEVAVGRFTGTCDKDLFRQLWDRLQPGDVVLGDCHFCAFCDVLLLQRRGVDVVFRMHPRRRADFRRGRRLGPGDHVVFWAKARRPPWMTREAYRELPAALAMREVRVQVRQKGFRTRAVLLATTLLDPAQARRDELAALFRMRWQAELNFRSLKQTLPMDQLRGRPPAMARKEIWAHLRVYNLLRGLMAPAARQAGVPPWELSFKGALQAVNAWAPLFWTADSVRAAERAAELVRAVAAERVGDRPDRYEPRAIKRRPREYPRLMEPRAQARKRLETRGKRQRK